MRHVVTRDRGQQSQIRHSDLDTCSVDGGRNLRRQCQIKAVRTLIFLKHHEKLDPALATLPASFKHATVDDTGMCPPV